MSIFCPPSPIFSPGSSSKAMNKSAEYAVISFFLKEVIADGARMYGAMQHHTAASVTGETFLRSLPVNGSKLIVGISELWRELG